MTKHLTPPIAAAVSEETVSNIESMQALVNTQNEQVIRLLNVVKIISPQLLGSDATKIENGLHENIYFPKTLNIFDKGTFFC